MIGKQVAERLEQMLEVNRLKYDSTNKKVQESVRFEGITMLNYTEPNTSQYK
jgi:hypothetical protein